MFWFGLDKLKAKVEAQETELKALRKASNKGMSSVDRPIKVHYSSLGHWAVAGSDPSPTFTAIELIEKLADHLGVKFEEVPKTPEVPASVKVVTKPTITSAEGEGKTFVWTNGFGTCVTLEKPRRKKKGKKK